MAQVAAWSPPPAFVLRPVLTALAVIPDPERTQIGLRRLFLQILLPLSERGETVHGCTVSESALGCGNILALAGPRFLRGGLERAPIAESKPPRERRRGGSWRRGARSPRSSDWPPDRKAMPGTAKPARRP